MLGPYLASREGLISYKGNKQFDQIRDITSKKLCISDLEKRVVQLNQNLIWGKIANINHTINISTNEYFDRLGAKFTLLPLTTRMISSPGAIYGKENIDYTTDTCPITLKWFDLPKKAFLSESSQIYLELALVQKGIDHVYSIYNSFRKEKTDATHLSEFHHIEYEGKVNQKQNENIALGLLEEIINDLLHKNESDLSYFLKEKKLRELENLSQNLQNTPRITFREALDILTKETKRGKYQKFTIKDNFGFWEEVKLTEVFGSMVRVTEFPLLEVPFYHATVPKKEPKVADNADFIWPGYRETIGSGHRISSKQEIKLKAQIFNLPKEDYKPYLPTRSLKNYKETSGFGLGWERMLQGLLEMPFIWSASQFPRIDKTLKP